MTSFDMQKLVRILVFLGKIDVTNLFSVQLFSGEINFQFSILHFQLTPIFAAVMKTRITTFFNFNFDDTP